MTRKDPRTFGRKPYQPTPEQRANRRAAIVFAAASAICFAGSMIWDQPVAALAAFIFLTTAALVAKGA